MTISKLPSLGQNDFRTPGFNKSEYNWFRIVTQRIQQLDILADVADVTLTSVTFPTVTSADAATRTAPTTATTSCPAGSPRGPAERAAAKPGRGSS